jgi:hypothetical protein
MKMAKETFDQGFDRYVCEGDSISTEIDGVVYTAILSYDSVCRPTDFDCYSDDQVAAWWNEDWFFVGITICAEFAGIELESLESLWGIEANLADDNSYLTEVANELLLRAIPEAQRQLADLHTALNERS